MNMDVMDRLIESLKTEIEGLRFDMSDWAEYEYDDDGNECGTVACIAGHVIYNEDRAFYRAWVRGNSSWWPRSISFDKKAAELLGITKEQSGALFVPNDNILCDATRDDAVKMLEWFRVNTNADCFEIRIMWDKIVYSSLSGVSA